MKVFVLIWVWMLFAVGASAQQQLEDLFKTPEPIQNQTLLQARQLYANGLFRKAIKVLHRDLKQHPNHFNAYILLGFMHYEEEEYERGALYYAKAVKLDPAHTGAIFMRGNCFLKAAKFRLALKDYVQCIRLDADFYPAYNNIAVVRLLYQDIERTSTFDLHLAKKDLDEVLAWGTDSPDKAVVFNMGFIYLLLWEFGQAVPYFDKAIGHDAAFAKAWYYRGYAHYHQKNYNAARHDFAMARKLGYQPDRCDAYVNRLDKILNYLSLQRPEKPEGW